MVSKFRHWRIFGGALAALLLAATPANADPISAAIAAIVASIQAITVAGVIAFVAETVVGIGLSYLLNAALGTGKQAPVQGITGTIQTGGIVPRSFLVGEYATAGSLGYVNTWGQVDKTPNSYFTMRIDLADLPMNALTEIWVLDTPCTYNPAGTPTAWGYPVPEFKVDGVDYLWVKFYDGTQTAADSWLVSQFSGDPNYPYSADMVGYGCAYMIVTARLNPNLFSGFPTYKAAGEGIALYDPRLDSTNGGSGAQRFGDDATWAYSNNAAAIIYNLLKGVRYGDQWLFGLQGMTAARLPASSWIAGLNEADLPTPKHDGGYEVQYRAGGEVQVSASPIDVINEFLKACNARVAEVGGSYKILVGAAGAPVMYLTDDGIIVTEQQTFNPFPTLSATVNGCTAHYPEPAQGWATVDAPALYNPDLEEEDGDRRLLADVTYGAVPYFEQVQRLEISAVAEGRRFRRHNWTLPPICWLLEPNDVVGVNSTRNSYVDKRFRLDAATDNANLDVPAALTECDPADYSYNPATQFQPRTNGPLVIAAPTAQAVLDWAASATIITGDGGKARPGILLAWNSTSDDVKGVHFEVEHVDTGQILSGQTLDYAAGEVTIDLGFLPNTLYRVRGILIPGSERDVDWSEWLEVTTEDVRITYDELSDDIQADLDLAESLLPRVDAVEVATGKAQTAVRGLISDQVKLQNVLLGLQAKIPALDIANGKALALAKNEIYTYTDGATLALAQHLLVLEATVAGLTGIDGIETFEARLIVVETATADLETEKASVDSVEALDAQINTPDTGLAAQVTYLSGVVDALDPESAVATISETATAARAHGLSLQSMGSTLLGILSKLNKLDAGQSITLAYYRHEIVTQVTEGQNASADAIGQLGVLMQTATGQLQANIDTEQHARTDGDSANASTSTSILAAIAGYEAANAVSAAFTSEANTRASADSAAADRLDEVEAILGPASAGAFAALSATVDSQGDTITAQGDLITGVQAAVDDASAGGYLSIVAQVAPGDASARVALVVHKDDSGNPGDETTAAILLDALSDGTSRAMLTADKIFLVNGSDSEAISGILSFIDGVLTVDAARITGELDVGTLIADEAIITRLIAPNAVSDGDFASGDVTTTFNVDTEVVSLEYDSGGGRLSVRITWRVSVSYFGLDIGGEFTWALKRDGSTIDSGHGTLPSNPGTLNNGWAYGSAEIEDSLAADTYTYSVEIGSGGSGQFANEAICTIAITELKK